MNNFEIVGNPFLNTITSSAPTPPPAGASMLLLEDGDDILFEDGSKVLIEG